jgi:hypothetical protein
MMGMGTAAISNETYWRCAVSRAYYAAYHVALLSAVRDGYSKPSNKGSHEGLIDWYTSHRDPRRTQIGGNLENLFRARVSADYYRLPHPVFPVIDRNNALLSLLAADGILQDVAAL